MHGSVMQHVLKTVRTTPAVALRQDGAILPPELQGHFLVPPCVLGPLLGSCLRRPFLPWLGLVLVPIMSGDLEMRVYKHITGY